MVNIITPSNGKRIDPALVEWDDVEKLWLHGGLDVPERLTPFSLWAVMKHNAQIEILTGREAMPMRREGMRLSAKYGVSFDDWSAPAPAGEDIVEAIIADIEAAIADDDEVGGRKGGLSDHAFAQGKTEAMFLEELAIAVSNAAITLAARGHSSDEIASDVRNVIDNERHRFRSLCDAAGRPRDMTP